MKAFKPVSAKLVIESSLDNVDKILKEQAAEDQKAELANRKAMREAEEIYNLKGKRQNIMNRFNSFSESLTHALLSESIMYVFKKAIRPELLQESGIHTMMCAMTGEFIKEDAADILYKMRTATPTTSEMYNLITKTKKAFLEADGFDKDDPSTYRLDVTAKDDFFNSLDNMDTESITGAIRDRVQNAVDDFMLSNRQDHDRIMTALQMTNDKLAELKDEPEEVKESYQAISKRKINKIRSRKKGVFESMVSAMCESVMKNDELKEEFTEGAKLNIPKIVDRIETMYTFIETVNTMRLYPIDEEYMQNLIEGLRK